MIWELTRILVSSVLGHCHHMYNLSKKSTLQIVSVKWLEICSDSNYRLKPPYWEHSKTLLMSSVSKSRLSKGSDNSDIVQLQVLVDSASDVTASDLEETVKKKNTGRMRLEEWLSVACKKKVMMILHPKFNT